ncbi:unnamed protein product [Paramecium octaurelia]|uniref:Uncharacterized protein n=1 Tax=Paramecium octaurelia TaxID=43137 RepID=A0A8S1YJV4_PAROT|nr:unnamed protein product [Paramecium octaurelia]
MSYKLNSDFDDQDISFALILSCRLQLLITSNSQKYVLKGHAT